VSTAEAVFWVAIAVPVYVYIGYPVALIVLRRLLHRPVRKGPAQPFISVLIPAYNEADVIQRKIRNTLETQYPLDRLEIVVASDGSRDNTAALAKELADGGRVRVLDFPVNRGKIHVLNDSVRQLRGDVVVFSDAACMLRPDSIPLLMENFADPAVGAASGLYRIIKPDEANIGNSEDFYWKYETFLKIQESELASVLGGHGHLHAIRRELYPYPPPGTINDDYVIPVSVIPKGYRAVYEPRAVVLEEAQEMAGFGRRVRIMAGNVQQLREVKPLLFPPRLLPLFFFLSHKAARLLVPFAMITALLANAMLLDSPFYALLFWLQVAFYLLAILGTLWQLRPKTLRLPFYFCMINAATFFGLYHALTSRRKMAWK
jgi:cellulose synthase/poly-beta-1,6-N-acetylglucosamine synthase-like glycosyltransferase